MNSSVAPAAPDVDSFGRDALIVTVCTLVSRLTGFVRVLVAAAVLSTGALGDTYHAANTVPNLLFELVAGGVLQAFLVPTFVAARRSGGDDELGRATGSVVGAVTVALTAIAAVMMLLSPVIRWAFTSSDDATASTDRRSVMTRMLVVFIPQIIFYGIGMVTTAALAARRRFAAAALAPAVNNLIVIGCYLLYRASRERELASLDLDSWQFFLLAGGTTIAVVAFTAVPGAVLIRQGVNWRPRWEPRHPAVLEMRRSLGWATLSVVGTLVPTAAAMALGYRVEGGVAVFVLTFAFFVLPHSLVAVPVTTALAPRVAEAWQQRDGETTGSLIDRGARVIVPLLLLGGAAMVALAWPVARVASFGQAALHGRAPIAHALAMFGFGLVGYGMAYMMMRVLFSLGDVRQGALLVSGSAVVGVLAMVVAVWVIPDADRATALALGYGAAQTVSAVVLTIRCRSLTGYPTWTSIGRLTIGSLIAAGAAGALMFALQSAFDSSRWSSLAAIVVAGAAGAVVFVGLLALLAGVRPGSLLVAGRVDA